MELRRATAKDWLAAREVRLQSLTHDPEAFCTTLEDATGIDDQAWCERLKRGFTVLAWNGSTAVATVTGKDDPHEPGGCEIVALWVNPAQRGKGLAHALIASVIDWARSEGAHEVALWVAEDNVRALALYERSGFVLTGERDVMPSGTNEIRLRKELTEPSL